MQNTIVLTKTFPFASYLNVLDTIDCWIGEKKTIFLKREFCLIWLSSNIASRRALNSILFFILSRFCCRSSIFLLIFIGKFSFLIEWKWNLQFFSINFCVRFEWISSMTDSSKRKKNWVDILKTGIFCHSKFQSFQFNFLSLIFTMNSFALYSLQLPFIEIKPWNERKRSEIKEKGAHRNWSWFNISIQYTISIQWCIKPPLKSNETSSETHV